MTAVYIHWPFCLSKCPYCDFNSHVAASIDQSAWARAYAQEIAHYAGLLPGIQVTSVFFGGGTPSLMEPETVSACLDALARHWGIADGCEISMEANPTSIEAGRFAGFRAAGVNRVSVGVQALNDADLAFLGRQHSALEAIRALDIAARTFSRYSLDLIYARPGQTLAAWESELRNALPLAGGHISLYQLTIEPQTPFHTRFHRGEFTLPPDDTAADLYNLTGNILGGAGYVAYEVSNYAQPGQECRHNLAYWHYRDYVGIGPGAHGRLTLNGVKYATRGHRAPDIWLQKVAQDGHGAHPFDVVSPRDRVTECLMMNVRLAAPFDLMRLAGEGGTPGWQEWVNPARIDTLMREGDVMRTGDQLAITAQGRLRLNAVIDFLLDESSESSLRISA